MHSVLAWRYWLLIASAICAGIVVQRLSSGVEPLQAAKDGASLTATIATVFVSTPVWRLLWLLPVMRRIAPPLDGEWTGVVRSNWTIIEAMKEGAKQSGAAAIDVDAMPSQLPALREVPVRAFIKSSFFSLELRLETDVDKYQISSLKSVEFKPVVGTTPAMLSYVFVGEVLDPKPGDVPAFDGAATLCVETVAGQATLEGKTWTNRAWTRGLNTAGVIRLRRDKPDFWAPLTFGLVKR
jgi:hypothetical protein